MEITRAGRFPRMQGMDKRAPWGFFSYKIVLYYIPILIRMNALGKFNFRKTVRAFTFLSLLFFVHILMFNIIEVCWPVHIERKTTIVLAYYSYEPNNKHATRLYYTSTVLQTNCRLWSILLPMA